jgi:hypothetical protein
MSADHPAVLSARIPLGRASPLSMLPPSALPPTWVASGRPTIAPRDPENLVARL